MEQPNDHPCPECGAPRRMDNTPSCACTERAAEALRDARTAQAAAAEDFDPLRIRPYVELDGPAEGPRDETMRLRPVDAEATSVLPTPLVPASAEPSVTDLRLLEDAGPEGAAPEPYGPGSSARRRRRTVLLAAVSACVAVVAAAGYASGLFAYESPSRDTALPDDVRASVPDAPSTSPASTPPTTSAPAAPPAPAPPPPAVTTPSPSPSPTTSSPSPSPSKPTSPPPTPTTSPPTGLESNARQKATPVLRRGDQGPEVTELQLRLRQLYLYNDSPDGNFTDRVEEAVRNYQWSRGIPTDDLGTYDEETRTRLETETREP